MVDHGWISLRILAFVLMFQIVGSVITTSPLLDSVLSKIYAEGEEDVIKKEERVLPKVDLVVAQQVINYSVEAIPTNFTDISSTGNNTSIDSDDSSVEVPIGFNFTFYENEHDSVFVSSNGFMTFDAGGSTTFTNDPIPGLFLPNNFIAPFWDDLNPEVSGSVLFEKFGVAPNRMFIVQWDNIPPFDETDGYKFQAKLHESSSNIEFQYVDVISDIGGNGTSATVGVEDLLGTRGTQFSFNSGSLFDGLGLLFAPTDFNFALSADPDLVEVERGDNVASIISVELTGGSSEPVSLECTFPPSDISCSFDPASVDPSGSSVLTISASDDAPERFVLLTIEGSAGGIKRTTLIGVTIFALAEIHGIKYADLNGNGIREPDESGMPDWTIFLCCPDSEVISTMTDDQGRYSFTELDPFSCYFVFEELRADFVKSAPMLFDHQVCFFLSADRVSTGNDFGNMPFSPGEIHGIKFADLNGNGARDDGEPGLPDWGIRLATHDPFGDMIIMKTKTNEFGEYNFTGVPFGLHTIVEVPQEGFSQTLPQAGDFSWTDDLYPFVVTAESLSSQSLSSDQMKWRGVVHRPNTTSTLGVTDLVMPAAIETFEDPVGDTFGSFSSGGSKLDITSVGAHYEDDSLIIEMTFADPLPPADFFGTVPIGGFIDIDGDRDASTGALSFQSLFGAPPAAGLGDEFFIDLFGISDGMVPVVAPLGFNFFSVIEFAPITFSENSFTIALDECIFGGQHFNYGAVVGKVNEFATDEVANDRILESTGSPSCPNPPRFVPIIRSGEVIESVDFGNEPFLTGEIHGVKYEDVNANGVRDEGEQGLPNWTIMLSGPISNATLTDDEGRYSFTDLPSGLYIVSEEIKDGYVQSGPPGFAYFLFLEAGEVLEGNDFGNMPFLTGEIHGVKFEDVNANGVRDEGEQGLAGWDILLEEHDQFGNILPARMTTTNESGEYSFDNVQFGLHFIVEILQDGWKQIAPEQGDFSWVNDLYPFPSLESLSSDSQARTREWKGVSTSSDVRHSELAFSYKEGSVGIADAAEDPVGDTIGSFEPQIDISSISANYGPDNLEISMTFAGPISPPSDGQSNSVVGFIDIDVDRNTSTGAHFPPPAGLGDNLGVEFYLDLFGESEGMVPLVAPLGFNFFTTVAYFPISFSETSFTVTIPHCFFASDFNYGAEIGTFLEITDIVPNENALTSTGTPSCPNRMLFVPILRSSEVSEGNDFGNMQELFCGKPVEAYASVIDGTENDDTLIGTSGINLIRGFGGNDRIEGRGSHDCLIGGEGNDLMFGNGGKDMIEGEDGDDVIAGGGGNDVINGGKGNDSIKGNAGDDAIDGGDDSDTCKGGTGSNTKKNCEA